MSSCTLRIARDLFALLPLNTVIIHAYDTQLNTETGHEERILILSIQIDREILNGLNFDYIDCSDSLNNFPHHMNFRKTKGFGVVGKINVVWGCEFSRWFIVGLGSTLELAL